MPILNQRGAILPILVALIVLVGIIVTVKVVDLPKIFRSKASDSPIQLFTSNSTALPKDASGVEVTTSRIVKIQLTAPDPPTTSFLPSLIKDAYAANHCDQRFSCQCPNGAWSSQCYDNEGAMGPCECSTSPAYSQSSYSTYSQSSYTTYSQASYSGGGTAFTGVPTSSASCSSSQTWSSCSFTCGDGIVVSGGFCWGRGSVADSQCGSAGRCASERAAQCPTQASCRAAGQTFTGAEGPPRSDGSCPGACTNCAEGKRFNSSLGSCEFVDHGNCPQGTTFNTSTGGCVGTPTGGTGIGATVSQGSAAVTATSYIITDSPVDPTNPLQSDPNAKTGTIVNNVATIDNFTLSVTTRSEVFLFVKFTYSNNQSKVVSKRLKYDPNFGATPTPTPSSAQPTPTPTPRITPTLTPGIVPTPTPQVISTPVPSANLRQSSATNLTADNIVNNQSFLTEVAPPPQAEGNLLVNGNFEQEQGSLEVVQAGLQCTPGGDNGSCIRDHIEKKNGNYSMKIEFSGSGFGNQFEWPNIRAENEEQFCLSYWVKRDNLFTGLFDKPMVGIQSSFANVDKHFEALYPSALTTDWQFVQGTVTVGKDWVLPVKVFLRSRFRFGDTNWFDDASLTRGAC